LCEINYGDGEMIWLIGEVVELGFWGCSEYGGLI
jgi:hypothetical protein